MKSYPTPAWLGTVAKRVAKFGLVGASGVLVDMAVLALLADPRMLGLGLSVSKALAAETALVSNFFWNDIWTFRDASRANPGWRARAKRLGKFNLICLAGIGLNVALLNAQVRLLGVNVYLANLIAIFLVSVWNFGMSLKFGWGRGADLSTGGDIVRGGRTQTPGCGSEPSHGPLNP